MLVLLAHEAGSAALLKPKTQKDLKLDWTEAEPEYAAKLEADLCQCLQRKVKCSLSPVLMITMKMKMKWMLMDCLRYQHR